MNEWLPMIAMRPTIRLFHNSKASVTLFTRRNCSLCDTAKSVVQNLRSKKCFEFQQLDVMASDQRQWLLYEFDVPVVSLSFNL